MFWKFTVLVLLGALASCEGSATEDGATDGSLTNYQTFIGVLALISLVVLVALCASDGSITVAGGPSLSGNNQTGNPIPPWTKMIAPDPALDTGFAGTSDGLNIINNNCVHRHRKGAFETDGARWGAPLEKGKHVFEIYWPAGHRGTHAQVGVGSEDAPLFIKPKESLVGSNKLSWGLDIARRRLFHNGQQVGTTAMPRTGTIPDKFYMLVDCDGGTLGFATDHAYWGAPLNIQRANFPVYAMIGSSCENSQMTMIYRGSEDRSMAPGNIKAVSVPSTGPGGQVQVTVVNPGVVQVAGASGYGQPEPPPAYTPNAPPSYETEKKEGEPEKEPLPDDDKAETHIAPIQVSGL